jgi:hypothetical protein
MIASTVVAGGLALGAFYVVKRRFASVELTAADGAIVGGLLLASLAAFGLGLPAVMDLFAPPRLAYVRDATVDLGGHLPVPCRPDPSAVVLHLDRRGRVSVGEERGDARLVDAETWTGASRLRVTADTPAASVSALRPVLRQAHAHGVRELEVWTWAHEEARSQRYGRLRQRFLCARRIDLEDVESEGPTIGDLSDHLRVTLP